VYRRYTSSAHDSAFTIAAFFEAGFARAAAFGGVKAAVRGLMLFVNIFSAKGATYGYAFICRIFWGCLHDSIAVIALRVVYLSSAKGVFYG
jgi:hypothetical protein